MLYDINTGKPYPVPDWAKKHIDTTYPSFKEKGLTVVAMPDAFISRKVVRFNHPEDTPSNKVYPPNPSTFKARGSFMRDDETFNIQYSKQPPRVDRSGVVTFSYPHNMVQIEHGFKCNKGDYNLAFYLEFLCPNIAGNQSQNPSSRPFWKFQQLEADAAAKIRSVKEKQDLERTILLEKPYEVIKKTLVALNTKLTGDENRDRIILFDKVVKGSEATKANAMMVLNAEAPKAVVSELKESESELVNRLLDDNLIKFEDGSFYQRDKRGNGDKFKGIPFFEASSQDKQEAFFELVDHLKHNTQLFDSLRK